MEWSLVCGAPLATLFNWTILLDAWCTKLDMFPGIEEVSFHYKSLRPCSSNLATPSLRTGPCAVTRTWWKKRDAWGLSLHDARDCGWRTCGNYIWLVLHDRQQQLSSFDRLLKALSSWRLPSLSGAVFSTYTCAWSAISWRLCTLACCGHSRFNSFVCKLCTCIHYYSRNL